MRYILTKQVSEVYIQYRSFYVKRSVAFYCLTLHNKLTNLLPIIINSESVLLKLNNFVRGVLQV